MVKILVDTCTWLELAKKPDQIKLLKVINALIDENIISLLVPEPILDELNRNKDRIIKDSNKGLQDAVKKAKLVVEAHGENNSRKAIIEHLDNVGFKIPNLQESSLHIIKTIETLLSKALILPVSDEIILKSAKRAIEKKAPFHRSKNSINDAIIMECYGKEVLGSIVDSDQFFFISLNINDFSSVSGNHNLHHPDFDEYFKVPYSQYSIDLEKTIRGLNIESIEELFLEQEDYYDEPRLLSEIIKAENEFFEKIWYNRHKNSLYEKYQNLELNPLHPGYTPALKIERKYGRDSLKWDDFEWGMINGKLSALRWVLGDDWDFLDT